MMIKNVFTLCLLAVASLAGCGGGGDDDNFRTDENGRNDMKSAEIMALFGAIGQQCAGLETSAPDNEEGCRSLCDCSTDAAAKLEGVESLPDATAACYHACSPSFVETNNDPVSVDDEDHAPDHGDYYLDYILACDEVAHHVVHGDSTAAQECESTCNCIADHMENTISEEEDDSFRELCLTNCNAGNTKSSNNSSTARMLRFLSGGK